MINEKSISNSIYNFLEDFNKGEYTLNDIVFKDYLLEKIKFLEEMK